ncbi:hypothetical protein RRG08_057618 [Elysia crispata]|uniref:Uncharacterized protein n=1 Tax=Elysia crispata TaxID=231223 RepID=A0AAE1A2D6_9GAST|nr:hypothetical protein RRG08_057618 [Elysia crispata]
MDFFLLVSTKNMMARVSGGQRRLGESVVANLATERHELTTGHTHTHTHIDWPGPMPSAQVLSWAGSVEPTIKPGHLANHSANSHVAVANNHLAVNRASRSPWFDQGSWTKV